VAWGGVLFKRRIHWCSQRQSCIVYSHKNHFMLIEKDKGLQVFLERGGDQKKEEGRVQSSDINIAAGRNTHKRDQSNRLKVGKIGTFSYPTTDNFSLGSPAGLEAFTLYTNSHKKNLWGKLISRDSNLQESPTGSFS